MTEIDKPHPGDGYADWRAGWVARHLGHPLTPFQQVAVGLICDAMQVGPYDFVTTFRRAEWNFGNGVSFVVRGELATWDAAGLTRLVIGAHDRCVRVSVEGCGPRMMRVSMWPRTEREGSMHKRHPTIEQAVEHYRLAAR